MLVYYYFIHEPIHQPIVRRNRTSTADIIQENNGGDYLSMIYTEVGGSNQKHKRWNFNLLGIYFSEFLLLLYTSSTYTSSILYIIGLLL